MENKHHVWCVRFADIIEGSCLECEYLYRQYPAEGHLNYEVKVEENRDDINA